MQSSFEGRKWYDHALIHKVSDTYGGREVDPIAPGVPDIDVQLEVDLETVRKTLADGSDRAKNNLSIREKFNIQGRGLAVVQHLSRIMAQWSNQYGELLQDHNLHIGLFGNAAARIGEGGQPAEFHIAELPGNLRIVAPPEGLQIVPQRINRLLRIPNNDNGGLWKDGEQHRSLTAHTALECDRNINLSEQNPRSITDMRILKKRIVRYVDVHGNLISYGDSNGDDGAQQLAEMLHAKATSGDDRINVTVGDRLIEGKAVLSLEGGCDGDIIAYANGGDPQHPNIDVIAKYNTTSSNPDILDESAYRRFGMPTEGVSHISID